MKNVTVTIWFNGDLEYLQDILEDLTNLRPKYQYDYLKDVNKDQLKYYKTEQTNTNVINIPIGLYIPFAKCIPPIKF